MTAPPRLFIATPTANGMMMADHVNSLLQTSAQLHRAGIAHQYRTVDGPGLFMQRDMLAADFLASDCTHLLLVEARMAFAADLAERLLAGGKPFIGVVHPQGPADLAKVATLAPARGLDAALALSYDWGVAFDGDAVRVEQGFCRVAGLTSGILLIERACLETMIAGGHVETYRSHARDRLLHAFFRDMPGDGAPRLAPEGLIAERWRAAGGEVWAYVAGGVRNVCDFPFGMPFSDYLKGLGRPSSARPVKPAV